MDNRFRSRNFVAVLYQEDNTHSEAVAKLINGGYKFCGILHDKDVYDSEENPDLAGQLKKPHWHILISFPSARWNTSVCAELGIADNYLQKCSSVDSTLLYFVHHELPSKAQYSIDDVFGHKTFIERLRKLLSGDSESQRLRQLVSLINAEECVLCPSDVLTIACDAELYDVLRRCPSWVMQDVLYQHNRRLSRSVGDPGIDNFLTSLSQRCFAEQIDRGYIDHAPALPSKLEDVACPKKTSRDSDCQQDSFL